MSPGALIQGTANDDAAVVRESLPPGDFVVTDGQEQLSEGSHVIVEGLARKVPLE